jgi:hypothetical protein
MEAFIMQQTLVVVFDNRADAQRAMNELVACGYPREQLRLSDSAATDAASRAALDHSFMSGVRHFFSDLFGHERSESARMYSEAVARGNHVLTLTAGSLPEVERAADIVERFGPIDIDEHASLWAGGQPARGGAAAMQQSAPGSQQFAQGEPQGAAQRTDNKAIPANQDELKVGTRPVERGGARIYQRVEETLISDDDAYFRGHWVSNYAGEGGTFDEYRPAYTYGSSMATSDLYRGRLWNDVEPHLRSDWEARNPNSAWEKMKSAIRHGWERMTS